MSASLFSRNTRINYNQIIKLLAGKSTNVDVIDSFTNELVQRKTLKWEIHKQKLQEQILPIIQNDNNDKNNRSYKSNSAFVVTKQLSVDSTAAAAAAADDDGFVQFDQLFNCALNDTNAKTLTDLIDWCIQFDKIPSDLMLNNVLFHFAEAGNMSRLQQIIDLCHKMAIENYKRNDGFQLYIGWCTWNRGNRDLALIQIKNAYENGDETIRKTICKIFKIIVKETVDRNGEATVVSITRVARELLAEYQELSVMENLWEYCFLSTWFSDQQLAKEIFDEFAQLRGELGKRTGIICYCSLQHHNLDAVHRLIELYLRHDMKSECKICLSLLFEYQYWRKNLRACSEIMRNSIDLKIPLSEMYSKKLINLLLGYPSMIKTNGQSTKRTLPRFELKF